MKSYNYWSSLELYSGDNDLSWTIIKAFQLNNNQNKWSPYDDPTNKEKNELKNKIKLFLVNVQENIEKDFHQWISNNFLSEKNILYKDFLNIIHDTSINIDKSFNQI